MQDEKQDEMLSATDLRMDPSSDESGRCPRATGGLHTMSPSSLTDTRASFRSQAVDACCPCKQSVFTSYECFAGCMWSRV